MAKSHLDHAGDDLRNKILDKDLDYTEADFSGADGRGVDFTGLTLCNADFTRAKLIGAKFARAKLTGAKFNYANLKGADFTGALVNTQIPDRSDSSSKNLSFSNAKLQGATFTKAVLRDANFTQVQTGSVRLWNWFVIAISVVACLISGFTSAVATTFALHYFVFTPRQTLPLPDQKPSLPASLLIGFWSIILIAGIRTIIGNFFGPGYVVWHVGIAITLILLALLFAALVMDESKANVSSLIWIALIALSPLVLLLATEAFTNTETWLASTIPFLADHVVKGLGGNESVGKSSSWIFSTGIVSKPTNGKWISGIYGAGIGAFFGCWFSRLALVGDERFAWLWKIYVEFSAIISTTFERADLTGAIFNTATLQGASFRKARIAKIQWHNAKCLDCACVGDTYLKYPKIRHLVVRKEWEGGDFNGLELEGINLEGAFLDHAQFVGTNLSYANLKSAILTEANLKKVSLEGADLRESDLTGAIIQA